MSSLARDHQAAGDEPRVLTTVDEPGRGRVQGRINITSPHTLDQRAGDVVMHVTVTVVAIGHLRDDRAHDLAGDLRPRSAAASSGQRPASIAAGEPHDQFSGLVVDGDAGQPSGWVKAREITARTVVVGGAESTSNIDRDSSGLTRLMLGFSVVAAISVIQPCSTAGSRTSCCVLENRWTSSMNRIVRSLRMRPISRACSMAARTSDPALTAANATNRRPDTSAASLASVVFPVPVGPRGSHWWTRPDH